MEFWLYADEPGALWNAQKALFHENVRYLKLMLRPALLTAFPAILLLFLVEQWYGRSALPLGIDSVFTVQLRAPVNVSAVVPVVRAPSGILVDGPPVRVTNLRQISWRIRPSEKTSGLMRIVSPGEVITRRIEAGTSRVAPEMPVRSNLIEWARISYPPASIEFLGLQMSPLFYFTVAWFLFTILLGILIRVAF